MSKGHFINNCWQAGQGEALRSVSPSTGQTVWSGNAATASEIDQAFQAARTALNAWKGISLDERISYAKAFQEIVKQNADRFASTLSAEMGKPLWESKTEVAAVAGKVDLAIDALKTRRDTTVSEIKGLRAVTRYKPHGIMGVLGPFNLPAHLPNGHIVPAILAGNTVVFKPSELTPKIAETMVEFWEQANLPDGVINLVQGNRDTGIALTNHDQLDGLLFTGSSRAGIAINQSLASQPQKVVALEMGGNNPLIVHECRDLSAAALETVLSAYITSGQRCTCARRLILVESRAADQLIEALLALLGRIRVGYFDDDSEPFLGPVVSRESGQKVLHAQQTLELAGAKILHPVQKLRDNEALLSPALLDVTGVDHLEDEEVFGPLLQITKVASFEAAIAVANQTRYGLSAGLLSDDPALFEQFIGEIRAGVVNWNRQTTGASGKLPFGGCGLSGNHRPSGYFAADYCSYPVASIEVDQLSRPEQLPVGIE